MRGCGSIGSTRPSSSSAGRRRSPAGRHNESPSARALAVHPRLLLLDEPMAALDVTIAPALRRLLRQVLEHQTTIIITHDVLDAFTLADRVAVMNNGSIIEVGETRQVFERPRSAFTAALVGLNLLTGTRTTRGLTTPAGLELRADPSQAIAPGATVGATVAPGSLGLASARGGADRDWVETTVVDLEPRGDLIRVSTEVAFADATPAAVATLDLVPGARVWLGIPPADLTVYAL